MEIIRKKRPGGIASHNNGCNITDNGKNGLGFNFTQEVWKSLAEHIEFGIEGNKLYFLPATKTTGYKIVITKNGNNTGRIAIKISGDNQILCRFVGNHVVKRGLQHYYIEI